MTQLAICFENYYSSLPIHLIVHIIVVKVQINDIGNKKIEIEL
jgi:hypothetical protein